MLVRAENHETERSWQRSIKKRRRINRRSFKEEDKRKKRSRGGAGKGSRRI